MKIILIFTLIAGSFLAGCKKEEAAYQKPPTPVHVQTVTEYAGDSPARYSANIRPLLQVELAFRIPGYVQDILKTAGGDGMKRVIQEGDSVKAGAVLAGIREGDYRAKTAQARSQLAEVRALVEQAWLDFERTDRLFRLDSVTRPEYEAANARLLAAQAKMAGAKAVLDEAEITLKDTVIRSPLDGVVLKRNIEIGNLVGAGTPAFVLADTSSMKAVFGVSDTSLQAFGIDSPITVVTESLPGNDFQGRISRISPSADPASRIFEVEVKIPNRDQLLKVGMIASVSSPEAAPSRRFPVIPLSAIVRPKTGSLEYGVVVVTETGGKQTARIRTIAVGEAVGSMLAVTQGLAGGERIVADGAQYIHDGDIIRVIP